MYFLFVFPHSDHTYAKFLICMDLVYLYNFVDEGIFEAQWLTWDTATS